MSFLGVIANSQFCLKLPSRSGWANPGEKSEMFRHLEGLLFLCDERSELKWFEPLVPHVPSGEALESARKTYRMWLGTKTNGLHW